jgi:hypothetical protein
VDAIWLILAIGSMLTMLGSAFVRGREAILRTIASAAVMVGLAFTDAGWIVHVGMAILLLSSTEFLFRAYYKVRREVQASFGCLAAVTAAALASGQFPWVVFPIGCMIVLWCISGGPQRNRRKEARALQRKAFAEASVQQSAARASADQLNQLFNDRRLPAPHRQKLHALLHRADALHTELRSRQVGDRLIFEVEQIHDDFAPTAVRGYLALPRATADTQPVQDGKTGAQLLDEQLTLLDGALDDIVAEARTHGADGLLASYRFLQNKFGSPGDELKL